ncbi:hypothetical protein PCAR4_900054 [Paraburkholderia caribensis]|uniref:Uncharacterized protein n=1 Tax=Paraburkholderia largidicola TaxID=3014751 RepID=A0A7I8C1H6_9BURK|nr:hypothetical protein PPGU16_73650 [Paraburkholderia sp. PGU16]CAG9271429.1 hypothetical protein PCAR4_900054 [Paraburkholderia caribensis]
MHLNFPQAVKPVTYRDYDDKDYYLKAGPGTERFEADTRCVHQEYRIHPEYDGGLRAEPDRVQRMGDPARVLEQGT